MEMEMDTLQTVIVTGATGFLGKALSETLLKKGITVYGIGRSEKKFKELEKYNNFHKIVLDFKEYGDISQKVISREIDAFFHVAYRGVNGTDKSDYKVQLQNLDLACTTVMQAVELGCKRYVYVGSVDEYEIAKLPDLPFCEPTHSRIYAAVKYASEVIGKTIAFENNIEYVSALLSLTYGENNKTNILPNMLIRNSFSGDPINLITGNNNFDMIYVKDAINGLLAVAEKGKPYESYFIGHEELRTFKEIVTTISDAIGNTGELNFGKYPDPSFSVDYNKIDRCKLYRHTGFRCEYDLSTAIERTKKWMINSEI